MPVIYDNKKIIPAPFCNIEKQYDRLDDGTLVGTSFTISFKGKIVADMGSPKTDGSFWTVSGYPANETIGADARLSAIIRKQEALRGLFATQGKLMEIQGDDGAAPLIFNPTNIRISFADGLWFEYCDYVITMEASVLYVNGTAVGEDTDLNAYHVSKASESWQLENADDRGRTYRLSHNVSAVGKAFYDNLGVLVQQPWENAKDYVLNRIGLGLDASKLASTGVCNLTNYNAYNYLRTNQIDELGGVFTAGETWLCYSPEGSGNHAIEEWNLNSRTSAEDGKTRVTLDGTITGLEVKNNSTYTVISTRWENAVLKWGEIAPSLVQRAQNYGPIPSLNPDPLTTSVGKNPITGVINYNYEYDDRASNQVTGAKSELITINWQNPSDVFASHTIPGKAVGPVLQDIETVTNKVKSVSIELVMSPRLYGSGAVDKPSTDTIISTYTPSPTEGRVYNSRDQENWVEKTGRYTRNVDWTYI